MGYLLGGVSAPGGCLVRVCVSGLGGCLLRGGSAPGGFLPQCMLGYHTLLLAE